MINHRAAPPALQLTFDKIKMRRKTRAVRCIGVISLCLAAASTPLAAQVVNMSHDLVTLGIANQNLAPNNPALDARPLFQAAFQYALNHTVQTLTIDTGSYYLLTSELSNAVLVVPGLTNMTI